jgi:predicted permease
MLLGRSLARLEALDPGFVRHGVVVASLAPRLNGYSRDRAGAFYPTLLRALEERPGVDAAGLTSAAPISGGWDQMQVEVEGYAPRPGEGHAPNAAVVSPRYFEALGMRILEGRAFSAEDTLASPRVVVINEAMARHFFEGGHPLGKRIGIGGKGSTPDREIVGVVQDAKYVSLREAPRMHFYIPVAQAEELGDLTLVARTSGPSSLALLQIRSAVRDLDPHLPLFDVKTLEDQVGESLLTDRFAAWLTGLFGLTATFVAALGLYGLLCFTLTLRTREFGIRRALGAEGRDIVSLAFREMGLLLAGGSAAGFLGALALARILRGMLFEAEAFDLGAFGLAAAVLLASAILATALPAGRAARADPLEALRAF